MKKYLMLSLLALGLTSPSDAQEIQVQGLELSTISIIDSDKDGVALEFDQCLATPYGATVDQNGCMVCPEGYQMDEYGCFQIVNEDVAIPVKLHFATNESAVSSDDVADLDAIRLQLKDLAVETIDVNGHTDAVGDNAYNHELSQKRAQSVAQTIERLGIKADNVNLASHGELAPIADNESEQGKELNRRVEAVIKAKRALKKYKEAAKE